MKKYKLSIIILFCILTSFIVTCFIPINASKLIPIIEEQVAKELGVNIHAERLIVRTGLFLKVKIPIMHLMYEDGQKFAQLDNVKFYIPWSSICKDTFAINSLKARKLTIRVNSDDKFLSDFLQKIYKKDWQEIPNIYLKEYSITYFNKKSSDRYILQGQTLALSKVQKFRNLKLKTNGDLSINSKKYINYDISLLPQINIDDLSVNIDFLSLLQQIKDLDFYSDIIADLKLYNNSDNLVQASGFINIDNISVLDSAKKNPKSFIYLTFLGNKASVLSNIYTSPNKKVYLEGMVNNSKKPTLDLKVKTDDIDLADLFQKIKILSGFSQLKKIEKAEGNLNANFTLKGDLNKIRSNGFLKINNGSIKANGVNVDRINAEIDFSNNIVNLSNVVGYVNKAPIILKGKIDKEIDIELLMNKVELKYLCPSSIGIQSGIASVIANIRGTLDNIIHKENISLENLKISNKDFDLMLDSFHINTNKSNMALISNIVCNTNETETIKIPTLKLMIDKDYIKTTDTNIYMPNSKLVLKSDVLNYNNNSMGFNVSMNGFINSKDINKLKTYSTRYPVKITVNGSKNVQNLNTQVLLEKTDIFDEPTILNLSIKKDKNIFKLDDVSITSYNGKFTDDLKANIKGYKKAILTGQIEVQKANSIPILKNVRIFLPQQLNINLFDTIAQIKGDLFFNGELNNPDIIGQIGVQNLFNQATNLSLSNATLDFNKNNLIINAPQLKLADLSLGINALVSTNFDKLITVKNLIIKSKYLNTDTILMYKDLFMHNKLPILVQDGKLYSEKVAINIYNSPLYLSALSSELRLKNNILTLKNLNSELYNGKISGTLDYNIRDEQFTTKLMARSVSAEPIFNIVTPRKDSISGTMDFDLNLNGDISSKQSLNGDVKFVINNGRMSTLGKLEHLLYAQNVVADNMLRTSLSVVTKAITLKDTGLFKYLQGDITLTNGISKINFLQSQGPQMALYIKGLYNTLNDYANLVVLGRLSDEIISGLGVFGDFSLNKLMIMLTGEDTKQNVLPDDFDKIPQLASKNTKEFKTIINGIVDKPSSVVSFNWVSYSQKSLRQKEIPLTDIKVPSFIEELPY